MPRGPAQDEERDYRYVIGIDLGTTNSAAAYVDLMRDPDASGQRPIHFFDIPQLVAPAETADRTVLPSFLYLPGAYDLPPGSTALPWDAGRPYAVGEFAREQGARVPGRLVASAKSWLCHAGVDRTADILPWSADADVSNVSPVEASRRYLQHIREAWDARIARGREGYQLHEQLVILTVPASFDEVARELTITAARQAGLTRAILLEEPLAAFYAWLSVHEDDWHTQMEDGQLILVCDVGGGTTDFSLVGIREGEAGLRFTRLAVGDHLMLGGDNMDLTLGRHLETKLMGRPGTLDALRWHQLVHECRKAKETLLGDPDAPSMDITVMGTAGKLIAGTLKGSLSQDEVQRLLLDGFFPEVALDAAPGDVPRRGLTELGLPYVHDPAITRHLAAFWQRFAAYTRQETGREAPYPDFLLFNGGVLIPNALRRRLQEIVAAWFRPLATPSWSPVALENPRPELAVAIGAAYYGRVRLGEGVRVGSGSPRAYYVGVAAGARAGDTRTAVCLIPRGTEEGFDVQLDEPDFEALANQPVAFHLFTSSTRLGDQLGEVVQLAPDEISVLPPIRTVLRYGKKEEARRLPVQLAVRLTEIGTLELWCQAEQTHHRWQLQFDVRQDAEPVAPAFAPGDTVDEALIEAAREAIRQTYRRRASPGKYTPERLRKHLEDCLDMPKEAWPASLIRKLADTLLDFSEESGITDEHEARWLNLLGFCLRPGFGDPVDEWRMKQVWKLQHEGLAFPRQDQCRAEWWVFWRRVAGGLSAGQQQQIYQQLLPYFQSGKMQRKKPNRMFPKNLGAREELEIWMALANFERLPAANKIDLGRWLLARFKKARPRAQELWALSRLGARHAMYGPLNRLIPNSEAAAWLKALLPLNLEPTERVAHALVHLARYTGDRTRDVPPDTRDQVARWLAQVPGAEHYHTLLTTPRSTLEREEQDWVFGESLPAGLVLNAPTPDDA